MKTGKLNITFYKIGQKRGALSLANLQLLEYSFKVFILLRCLIKYSQMGKFLLLCFLNYHMHLLPLQSISSFEKCMEKYSPETSLSYYCSSDNSILWQHSDTNITGSSSHTHCWEYLKGCKLWPHQRLLKPHAMGAQLSIVTPTASFAGEFQAALSLTLSIVMKFVCCCSAELL